MELTNLQGINFVNEVNGTMKGKRLPVRIAFAIKQNYAVIMENQLKPYEELRQELIQNNEDSKEGNEQLVKELNKLLEEKTKLSIKRIEITDLEKLDADPSYDKLSLSEIDAIGFMIKE